jgi:hypothetical protein
MPVSAGAALEAPVFPQNLASILDLLLRIATTARFGCRLTLATSRKKLMLTASVFVGRQAELVFIHWGGCRCPRIATTRAFFQF